MRQLTAKEVTFSIECMPEETPIEGNAMASGDDAQDKEAEDWVRSQLDKGNNWAWCTVRVEAAWTDSEGEEYVGNDFLGCCSYESEKDFTQPGGYFEQMKEQALADLNSHMEFWITKYKRLETELAD